MKRILIPLGAAALGLGAVVVGRTLALSPTQARDVKLEPQTGERAERYGKALSRMVQDETVSFRGQEDREKFYRFHQTLEELFPNVHAVCE